MAETGRRMIRIDQLKLPVGHTLQELSRKAAKALKIQESDMLGMKIRKRSLDARRKPLQYVYVLDVKVKREGQVLRRLRSPQIHLVQESAYAFPKAGEGKLKNRPVIVGSGPAGLFCALMLARAGYAPVVLEQGEEARKRQETVEQFWRTGKLCPHSNVQFGEGGAGTFSDGKLNTLVKDPRGLGRKVLELFVEAGAPDQILYENKPHLGTDLLVGIVEHMRKEIEALGGQVLFGQQMREICVERGRVRGVRIRPALPGARGLEQGQACSLGNEREAEEQGREEWELETEVLVLAIGHSARDTFSMLEKKGIPMEQKAFAVGVRVEHPQEMINFSQYGEKYPKELPAAAYKVTRPTALGRGVYSFCMCPGGYVVNASSEAGRLAINGMSYQARNGRNANSAMIVTVDPRDFGGTDILAGIRFQRQLEERAWQAGIGKIPVQLLGDFLRDKQSRQLGEIEPCIRGEWTFGDVRGIFPEPLAQALGEGITGCGRLIAGFDRQDAVLSGVESRTSSPVRILRDKCQESPVKGLFPCGEGAGYAGGITSAAMDGIRTAEEIRSRYQPL